jgi:hypothetical protein
VFAQIGGFSMEGLEQGLSAAAAGPLAFVRQLGGAIAAAGSLSLAASGPAMAASAPVPAAGTIAAPAGMSAITINVYPAPGMDEAALASLVAQKLQEARLADAARGRSRLTDAD